MEIVANSGDLFPRTFSSGVFPRNAGILVATLSFIISTARCLPSSQGLGHGSRSIAKSDHKKNLPRLDQNRYFTGLPLRYLEPLLLLEHQRRPFTKLATINLVGYSSCTSSLSASLRYSLTFCLNELPSHEVIVIAPQYLLNELHHTSPLYHTLRYSLTVG
jgi:hypothetical protein